MIIVLFSSSDRKLDVGVRMQMFQCGFWFGSN
jgi:hypothetical protein